MVSFVLEKESEKNLLRENHKVFKHLDNIGVIVVILNEKGEVTMINQAGCQVLGYEKEELIGNCWFESCLPPRFRDEVRTVFKQLMNGELEPVEYYENPVLTKNGEERLTAWYNTLLKDEDNRIIGMLSSGEDITERNKTENALRISNRLLGITNRHIEINALFEEFIAEIQDFTGCEAIGIRILDDYGNIPYSGYKGFSHSFYKSESPLSINSDHCMCINVIKGEIDPSLPFYTENGSFFMNTTTRFLATVSEEEKGKTRNVCNAYGYESVALIPIHIDARILGLIHIADNRENMVPLYMIEILERAAMQLALAFRRVTIEEALRESHQELQKVNAELKDFAYIVSHDLKAPLRSVNLLAEQLLTNHVNGLEEEGKENLSLLMKQVRRMNSLIQGILDYSRIERVQEEIIEVELSELLVEVINLLVPANNIEIKIETKLPTIFANSTRLFQVWQNLLSNAIKFIDKPQGLITINCLDMGGHWQFSITDNGSGIEEKHFDRIFKLFQTVHPQNEIDSTGAGLAIVKKIIQIYGGEIWVESEVGEGSTFFFTLPK